MLPLKKRENMTRKKKKMTHDLDADLGI